MMIFHDISINDHLKMEVSKSSISVLGGSLSSTSSFLMRFQDLSQNSICSRLMKLSLPMERRLQIALILFSTMFLVLRRQMRISVKVITLQLGTSQQLLNSPFFLISFMTFLICPFDSLGRLSCLKFSSSWMNSTSLPSSRISRQMISSFTPSSIGIPLYFFSPTVEMYLRGSMVEGQMQLRKPTKSIFSLQPYSPKRILISSSVLVILFSSRIWRVCLRVMSPSPREMQLKSARGWKSGRVVMDSRQACRMFSCCSRRVKYEQMLLKSSPSFSQAFLERLSRFITTILYQQLLIFDLYHKEMDVGRCVVIINADDYGCNQDIDRGILQLARQRVINSLSVMVNGRNIQAAAQKIRELLKESPQLQLELSVGLHFNITEGKPLSSAIGLSILVQNGEFIGKPRIYEVAKQQGATLGEQISQQLSVQVSRFLELFGRLPSHIDGHNHIHIVPNIAQPVAETMRKLGILRTRIPEQRLEKITLPINHMFIKYASQAKIHFVKQGILFAREFVGLESFGNLSAALLKNAIDRQYQHSDASVQLMCHPGYPATQGSQWVKSIDRLNEMHQLSSSQFTHLRFKPNYYGLM